MALKIHRVEIGGNGNSAPRLEGPRNPIARIAQIITGGVVLAATAVTGVLMGGVLLIVGAVAAIAGLAGAAYLRWKMRHVLKEAEKQFKENGGQAGPQVFMGQGRNGSFEFFVNKQAGGFGQAPAEEPVDVEVIDQES